MDVISYQKAAKAKKEIKLTQDRLGMNGTENDLDIRDNYENVRERLEELEKKNPSVDLYNRVSSVSTHTAVNLNKYNLKVSSLLNHRRYQLSDMIVDDFTDDSGIDPVMSVNYLYDDLNKRIQIAMDETKAEVVTIAEETEGNPQMIAVSQAANERTVMDKENDLSTGKYDGTIVIDGVLQLEKVQEDPVEYIASGFYESSVLDLGENFKKINSINHVENIPGNSSSTIFTATSPDGEVFSEYKTISEDKTIDSPMHRYIKVKVELNAASDQKEVALEVKSYSDGITKEDSFTLKSNQVYDKLIKDIHLKGTPEYDDSKIEFLLGYQYSLIGQYE
jgi:hypothetical protein